MNRLIKFRAWDGSKMHHDFQFIKSGNDAGDWILFVSDKQPLSDYEGWIANPFCAQQLKIMQYTGLLDSAGKEIFEGDILQDERKKISVVFWNEEDARFDTYNLEKLTQTNANDYKIIGNIHENPELLEGE